MYNVNIKFTKHRESGICTINELYKIIKHFESEIIFEEISPLRHNAYYSDNRVSSLETKAIKMYKKEHLIKNIPIDKHYENYGLLNFKCQSYLGDHS